MGRPKWGDRMPPKLHLHRSLPRGEFPRLYTPDDLERPSLSPLQARRVPLLAVRILLGVTLLWWVSTAATLELRFLTTLLALVILVSAAAQTVEILSKRRQVDPRLRIMWNRPHQRKLLEDAGKLQERINAFQRRLATARQKTRLVRDEGLELDAEYVELASQARWLYESQQSVLRALAHRDGEDDADSDDIA